MDFKRPKGYKAKPPVDLVRKTPKPGRRVPFVDPEDLTLATLAGPQGIKTIVLELHEEIMHLRREMTQIAGKHIHNIKSISVSTKDCNDSPIGLCCFKLYENDIFRSCVFCNTLED